MVDRLCLIHWGITAIFFVVLVLCGVLGAVTGRWLARVADDRESRMTEGEKAIWAAAYVSEYQLRRSYQNSRLVLPEKAAEIAIVRASEAVTAARRSLDSSYLVDVVHQGFLKSMVRNDQG